MGTKSKIAPTVGVTCAVLALSAVAVAAKPGRADPLPQGSESVNLNPADFTTDIDNPFWPMKPGSRWVYRETDSKGARRRVVVTVTDTIKDVAIGIKARVIHDVVTERGKPLEVTDDYYAQDRAGNIWYFGEATAEYENGKVTTREGSFEAGVDGAQPGVILPTRPKVGLHYREEYYKGHAEDRAQVVSLREHVEVPFAYFKTGNVLMTRNQDRLEPKVLEYKFMARGIGPVLEVSVSGGSDRAELLSFRPGK